VYSDLGRPEEALKSYQQALVILREVQDRHVEGTTLNNIGGVYSDLGRPAEALKIYQQALMISREVQDRRGEGTTLNNIGGAYSNLGKPEEALKSYQQALVICREVQNRSGQGTILNNIGGMYSDLGKPEEALKIYQQALMIRREVQDRSGEGTTLNNIGLEYMNIRRPKEALKSYEQALVISRKVQDRRGEGTTLGNLALVQRDQGQGELASGNLEKALTIQLEIRRGLQRKDRQAFLNQSQSAAATLVELLISQRRPAEAFRWANLFSSADLADYSRLIEAKLADPEAQRALDDWRQRQAALVAQRQRLEREPNERQLKWLVDQEAAQNQAAEALIGRYPVIAEVLETRPADLERLQAAIPAGTVVLQPVLLAGVPKRPDSLALFALSRNSLEVVSVPLPPKFTALVRTYRQYLENGDPYGEHSKQLYDLLIRPVEAKGLLPAGSRLALITSGPLRDIPLETLFDGGGQQYLIEKFPIHYLTRLSRTGPTSPGSRQAQGGASLPKAGGSRRVLVLANPKPSAKPIPGTEAEANFLLSAFPGSLGLRGEQATLARFQQQANRYPLLHLGTHGCFLPSGCPDLAMTANTLLFANGVQYPIAKAAELGLSNTELLVLAACQTARITTDNDVGVSGLAYVWERAGARAVVATLWNVDDQTSSQLIPAFYTNLQGGMDKAAAMRQAKVKLIRSDPNLHPYSWAPFIMIGDAAPLGQ
jgi:CHAT domain-containing protein/Tfp pilus assembly protein PilF